MFRVGRVAYEVRVDSTVRVDSRCLGWVGCYIGGL